MVFGPETSSELFLATLAIGASTALLQFGVCSMLPDVARVQSLPSHVVTMYPWEPDRPATHLQVHAPRLLVTDIL